MYRTERNYENLNKGIFPGAGRFDIPILRPELTTAENWISFNYAKGCEDPRTRRALGFAKAHSTSDSMSQFALLMGYNVITTKVGYNETYYTVIDRSALIMSKTRV